MGPGYLCRCRYDAHVPSYAALAHTWLDRQAMELSAGKSLWSEHPLIDLAEQVFLFPEAAGEHWDLLAFEGRPVQWIGTGAWALPWGGNDRTRSSALGDALRAERRWRGLQKEAQLRDSLWRPSGYVLEFTDSSTGHLSSSSALIAFEAKASDARARRVPSTWYVCAAEVQERADLDVDLAYWRRTADDLWRMLSTSVVVAPDLADVVVLDSSPCGIRRLTAVRVPRAPDFERTSPVPSSILLAAV